MFGKRIKTIEGKRGTNTTTDASLLTLCRKKNGIMFILIIGSVIGVSLLVGLSPIQIPEESFSPDADSKAVTKDILEKHKKSLIYMGNKKSNTGWYVDTLCFATSKQNKKPIVVYGIGAGQDISWDTGMVDKFGATVHIFDPTEKSMKHVKPIVEQYSGQMFFTPEGLSHEEGTITFALPANPKHVSMRTVDMADTGMNKTVSAKVNTLQNFMNQRHHDYLDVLKIDIEGKEYDVLENLIETNFMPFTQLLVEYHDRFLEPQEKIRHSNVLKGLKEKGGFIELWSQNNGQEVGYIKASDLMSSRCSAD